MARLFIPGNIRCAFKGSYQSYPYLSISGYFLAAEWSAQSKEGEDTPGRIMMHQEEHSPLGLLFQEAQCSSSPLGVFLPGLIHLSTTFTPSLDRMYLINCYILPGSSTNCALQVALKGRVTMKIL